MNKKAIVMPVLATLMLFLLIGIASACSCVYLENTKAKLDNAAYVFSGEVTNIDISENQMQQVRIRIINSYQPANFPEPVNLMIYAIRDSGSECGYNFEEGKEYLIYAYIDEETGKFTTNLCMGNSLLNKAEQEIKDLNKLTNSTLNQNNNNSNNNNQEPNTNNQNNNNQEEQNIFSKFFNWLKNLFS